MKFFKNLFQKKFFQRKFFHGKFFRGKKKKEETSSDFLYEKENSWENVTLKRDSVVMFVKEQRDAYIKGCLEQIKAASDEMERLTYEYNMVTSYLTDMEEIEALPEEQMNEVLEFANKIVALEQERKQVQGKANRMTEEQYRKVERMEDEVEEALEKLKKAEDYQGLIKQDLTRLDGEKHAHLYRKREVKASIENTKGMVVICTCALFACIAMLLVLQFGMKLDTQLGYIITAGVSAITITAIYMRHLDAKKELKSIERSINRIILLQNRVKIRYVNNVNLLEYLYLKYGIGSFRELDMLWGRYQEEKKERETLEQTGSDLTFFQGELIGVLKKFQLKDPYVWIHQADALVNNREMVEIRHNLIIRRQKLRKQLEDNRELAEVAQAEIKDIVEEYPKYAKEILDMVDTYTFS